MTEPLTKKEKAHRAHDRAEAREAAADAKEAEAQAAQTAAEEKAARVVTPPADGVGDRGLEQRVPFYTDGAARRFVASPHPRAGEPW